MQSCWRAGQVAAFGETAAVLGQYLSRDYLRPPPRSRIDVSALPRTGTGDGPVRIRVTYVNRSAVGRRGLL